MWRVGLPQVLSLFIFACLLQQCTGKNTQNAVTKQLLKQVKTLSKSIPTILDLVKQMNRKVDQCSNVTDGFEELSDKIDNIGGISFGVPDIDLTDQTIPNDGKPIRVDVNASFDECMADIDLEHIPLENAYIWCLRTVLWQHQSKFGEDAFEEGDDLELEQVNSRSRGKRSARYIRRQIAPRDMTRPPTGFRTRREYRALSLSDRQKFHNALNALYEDGTVECFALVHRGATRNGGAHRGVAFLAWHRAFLSLFEEALRQVDPDVSLVYWDSSIDDNMDAGPGLSVMWDDDHLGNGNGLVTSGPFANWVTVESPLRRDIARGVGSLIRQSRIDNLMDLCRLRDFDGPWENAHNSVHRWVGGTMARSLSPADPVFYMHHAFIDYQWEKFREHQLTDCGIDPAFDYPNTDDNNHAAETRMDGMRFLINRDGIADYWTTNWYNYENTPTCANNCANSPDMFCDTDKNLCVGEIRFDLRNSEVNLRQASERTLMSAQRMASAPLKVPDSCMKDPYGRNCPDQPPPRTQDEYIERVIRRDIALPMDIQRIDAKLQAENEVYEEYPPDSEPVFFHAAPDEMNDCRTADTSIYDLVNAVVRGKTVTKKQTIQPGYK